MVCSHNIDPLIFGGVFIRLRNLWICIWFGWFLSFWGLLFWCSIAGPFVFCHIFGGRSTISISIWGATLDCTWLVILSPIFFPPFLYSLMNPSLFVSVLDWLFLLFFLLTIIHSPCVGSLLSLKFPYPTSLNLCQNLLSTFHRACMESLSFIVRYASPLGHPSTVRKVLQRLNLQ